MTEHAGVEKVKDHAHGAVAWTPQPSNPEPPPLSLHHCASKHSESVRFKFDTKKPIRYTNTECCYV